MPLAGFATLEGVEGADKTQIIVHLMRSFKRVGIADKVVFTHEPGGTPLGEAMRQLLLEKEVWVGTPALSELLLFLAGRADHVANFILPSIAMGKLVICDRFTLSSWAYQLCARGIGEQLWPALEAAQGKAKPHRQIILMVPPEIGLQRVRERGKENRLDAEALEFHQRVYDAYQHAPERFEGCVLINANRPFPEVYTDVMQQLLWSFPEWLEEHTEQLLDPTLVVAEK